MGKTIFNKVKNSKIPVIKKELDDGVIAEANKDGSIYLNKNVKSGTPLEKEAIAHEMVHINQMKRGDLNYDDNNVYTDRFFSGTRAPNTQVQFGLYDPLPNSMKFMLPYELVLKPKDTKNGGDIDKKRNKYKDLV